MKNVNKLFNKIIVLLVIFIILSYGKNFFLESFSFKDDNSVINSKVEIYYLNVGQADSILINSGDDTMLIDAGNNSDGDNIVEYISSNNINDIDILVATHPHEDHIGGVDNIINTFDIGKIYMPDVVSNTKSFKSVLEAIESKKYSITVPKIGEEFSLGDMKFKVIYTGSDESDLNNTSIVLKMSYGNKSFLFTGDATSVTENIIVDSDIKSDVLKVVHHGSNYSTKNEFLNRVSPKYAIISVGSDNSYNHPASQTLERLASKNIKVYRTDIDGTIKIVSDGDNIEVHKLNVNLDGE